MCIRDRYIFDICNSIIGFLNKSRASLIATEVCVNPAALIIMPSYFFLASWIKSTSSPSIFDWTNSNPIPISFDFLIQFSFNCLKESKKIAIEVDFAQSNIEGELVNLIQDARKKYDGMIINAAGFTHTSVAIRDALDLFKKPIIELHISNIYKREEFRHKSLISDIATGGIFGLGVEGYILAIISIEKILKDENR